MEKLQRIINNRNYSTATEAKFQSSPHQIKRPKKHNSSNDADPNITSINIT